MNPIIKNLTIQNLKNFINSFNESKNIFWDETNNKLRHSGEYGVYREELVKKWLRIFIPEAFGISSGFIINSKGEISTQCDLIIYDKYKTPKIENIDNQRFFPVETVLLIGEIKSDINSIKDLNSYLIKLAEIKKLRAGVISPFPYNQNKSNYNFQPSINPFDNLFSILICNKFNFSLDHTKIDYKSITSQYRHNLVLSLNDGILNYKTNANTDNMCVPFMGDEKLLNNYLINDKDELPAHIISFLNSINIAISLTSLLEIDMTYYLTDSIHEKIV
jgi:hypothetical protein